MRHPALRDLVWPLACAVLFIQANPLTAQPFNGCPSEEILAAWNDFGLAGKPPPVAWRSFVRDPKAQYIEPWKAFDNVHYVGVCWVSAWAIQTNDGVVLIDTLHEPHVDQLVAKSQQGWH